MIDQIVPQSAGSLSIAFLALMMVIVQIIFVIRKPQFIWYGWGAAISFSGLLYAAGIFFEYNTPPGSINRFAGMLEFTALIFLIHSLYGLTFSYLGMDGKRYHLLVGIFHGFLFILLWFSNIIVADHFITRHFIGLSKPFIESDLGPLGALFILYIVAASIGAIAIWIRHKGPDAAHKSSFLAGMIFWVALGIHDGLATLGFPTIH